MSHAHVDESSARLSGGERVYVVAAVLTSAEQHPAITEALTAVQETALPLHFHTERAERRVLVAKTIAALELHGAILLSTITADAGQERARARLLRDLLPRLEHREHVTQVVLESRGGGDKHDRRTRDHLRRSRHLSAAVRVDHAPKNTPLLWLADWCASSYLAAQVHGEAEPWVTITAAHVVDVRHIDPR